MIQLAFRHVAIQYSLKNLLNFNCRLIHQNKMPSAIVVLPPGAEEMEFVGSVDILRRAGVRKL